MNILALNVSAAVMIAVTLLVRRIFKNRIPHGVFCLMWVVIAIRLFIPTDITSKYSFWNLLIRMEFAAADLAGIKYMPEYNPISDIIQNNPGPSSPAYKILWTSVALALGLYFLYQYISLVRMTKNAYDADDISLLQLFGEKAPRRGIRIKILPSLASPAALGIIRPTIFFPEGFDFDNTELVKCVLLHEAGHIKYFHTLIKIISSIMVCLYWYNPLVWVMYVYLDRDMEISADRYVIKNIGEENRTIYANALIKAAEDMTRRKVFCFHFKSSQLRERIEAVIKYKKISVGALIITFIVPIALFTVFATTDTVLTGIELEQTETMVTDVEYGDTPETMEDIHLEVPWQSLVKYASADTDDSIPSSYSIQEFAYITYDLLSPKKIYITSTCLGRMYSGTLSMTKMNVDAVSGEAVGYYSGVIYLI